MRPSKQFSRQVHAAREMAAELQSLGIIWGGLAGSAVGWLASRRSA